MTATAVDAAPGRAQDEVTLRDRILDAIASGRLAPRDVAGVLPNVPEASLLRTMRALHARKAIRVDGRGILVLPCASRAGFGPARSIVDATDAPGPSPTQDGPGLAEAATEATRAVLSEGGLWRAMDIRMRTGFGDRGVRTALAELRIRGLAVMVVHGHWRLASQPCDLYRDARSLPVRILGCLMDGSVRKISELPSGDCTPGSLRTTVKRLREVGLVSSPKRGYVACPPAIRAEVSRRLAPSGPGTAGQGG